MMLRLIRQFVGKFLWKHADNDLEIIARAFPVDDLDRGLASRKTTGSDVSSRHVIVVVQMGFLARTDAGSQTAHAGNGRARQQDGADCLGATCQAGELQGSGRSQGVILADLRSSEM
jgi:hypothetical protein